MTTEHDALVQIQAIAAEALAGTIPTPPPQPPAGGGNAPYPAGQFWQRDMVNGTSITSDPFVLPDGGYTVGVTDGLQQGYGTAVLNAPDGSKIPMWGGFQKLGGTYTATMTAVPGNPLSSPPETRMGMQIYGPF